MLHFPWEELWEARGEMPGSSLCQEPALGEGGARANGIPVDLIPVCLGV